MIGHAQKAPEANIIADETIDKYSTIPAGAFDARSATMHLSGLSLFPVAWVTTQMHNRDDNELVRHVAKQNGIRKRPYQATPHVGFHGAV
jgi:hypothetical protein